jgi:adenylate cyclase
VSKDDLIAAIWEGRIISETAVSTRINVVRSAIGDTGEDQRLIRTLPRKGVRFVGIVHESQEPETPVAVGATEQPTPALTLPDRPSIGCRRECGWNLFGAISGTMKLSDQAATSTS